MNPKTAVLIEPQGLLCEEIIRRKALLEQMLPNQAYTGHPPHSTLIFGSYGEPDAWLPELRARLGTQVAFPLHVDGWMEFPNDVLAQGGHTVAYRAKPTAHLRQLQLAVAETLAPYQAGTISGHPLKNVEPFATSLRRYGAPFVGEHWIPHFTIGAPRCAPDDPLLSLLMEGTPDYIFTVGSVSIWKVAGDNHERLHVIPFVGSV